MMRLLLILLLLPKFLYAEDVTDSKWQEVRDHQPPALHLKMALPKDHFFQGEKIDATLDFTNDDANTPYSLEVGTGIPGGAFHAFDNKGNSVVDPLQWFYDWHGITITGPVGLHNLGHYSLLLPANDTVRFDHPGVYTLYAQAELLKGTTFSSPDRTALVSDKVTITIDPLAPEKEKQVIADALQKIGSSDSIDWGTPAMEGISELNDLQTPAARAELIALMARPKLTYFVRNGLLGSPDPSEAAARFLAAVQSGKLIPDATGITLYAELKSYGLIRGRSPRDLPEKESQAFFDKVRVASEQARHEMETAILQASGDQGPAAVEALWTVFQDTAIYRNPGEKDRDGGKARAAMAAHQLELSPQHVKQLLDTWRHWGSADFLPLIRREAHPPSNNLVALIALVGIQPDEARPMVIKEFESPHPRFFETGYPSSGLLCSVAPMPLYQFDALFRSKLAAEKGNAFPIIPVIGCFGSAALLPDVTASYRQYAHGTRDHWDDAILECLFLYWLRCDPQGGAKALEQEIESRGKEGYGFLSILFRQNWTDQALPVANWALENPDLQLTSQGIYLLEKHGPETSIDPVIAILERNRNNKELPGFSADNASQLLKSERWHFSDDQKKRLQALAQP